MDISAERVRKIFEGLENGDGAAFFQHVADDVNWHASAYYTTFQSSFILKTIAPGRAQSAAVYGHNGRLALVPARLATPDPFDR